MYASAVHDDGGVAGLQRDAILERLLRNSLPQRLLDLDDLADDAADRDDFVALPQVEQRVLLFLPLFLLREGDEIVTVGGLIGEITKIKESLKDGQPVKTLEDRITIRSGDSTLVVHRGRIHQVIKPSGSDATTA